MPPRTILHQAYDHLGQAQESDTVLFSIRDMASEKNVIFLPSKKMKLTMPLEGSFVRTLASMLLWVRLFSLTRSLDI